MNDKKKPNKFYYVEPDDYFPKEIRKKVKIGEYAEKEKNTMKKKQDQKKTAKKGKNAK